MIDGATSKPFSAVTMPPREPLQSYKEEVISQSRKKFGRKREVVEKSIFERLTIREQQIDEPATLFAGFH